MVIKLSISSVNLELLLPAEGAECAGTFESAASAASAIDLLQLIFDLPADRVFLGNLGRLSCFERARARFHVLDRRCKGIGALPMPRRCECKERRRKDSHNCERSRFPTADILCVVKNRGPSRSNPGDNRASGAMPGFLSPGAS